MNLFTTTTCTATAGLKNTELWIWLGQGNKVHTQNVGAEIS